MARSNKFLAPGLVSAILLAACGGSSSKTPTNDGGTPHDAGTVDAGTDDAGTPDSGTPDAGNHDAGTPDAGPDGGSVPGPFLDTASAHVVGRRGRDLQLKFTGHDTNKDLSAVMVRLLDSSGNPVLGFDSHQSGNDDSALGPATPDTTLSGLATVSTTATLPGMALRQPTVASVAISLRDREGASSNEITVAVGAQTMSANGAACDTAYVTSRCPATEYCAGTSPTCQASPPPQITQLAYLTSDAGVSILVKGTSADDDLANLHIDFQDGGGQPYPVPLDGDNSSPVESFDLSTAGQGDNGAFLIVDTPASDFATLCPQIKVTPADSTGASGNPLSTRPVAVPIKGSGSTCDVTGFSACSASNVCTLSSSGSSYICAALAATQTKACSAAVDLAPAVGADVQTFAHTASASLWNPPAGCSAENPVGTPVGIAMLHLATQATTLTLSTDNPGTDFDTIVYLIPACAADSSGALGCNDDGNPGISVTSVLTLTSVPAGDYTVVVGSFDASGGNYQLTASVQ